MKKLALEAMKVTDANPANQAAINNGYKELVESENYTHSDDKEHRHS